MKKGVFSSYYLAPIAFFYDYLNMDEIIIDNHENFVKQTYRSRCYIMGPNGVQSLSIPLQSVQKKQRLRDIKISNIENWQKVHWKSLEAGYRRSPYFEYYEHLFEPFYTKNYDFLFDFNEGLFELITDALSMESKHTMSSAYQTEYEGFIDFRSSFSPKKKETRFEFPVYSQVFEDRNEFAENLSIVDLLFNQGPNSTSYLNSIKTKQQ